MVEGICLYGKRIYVTPKLENDPFYRVYRDSLQAFKQKMENDLSYVDSLLTQEQLGEKNRLLEELNSASNKSKFPVWMLNRLRQFNLHYEQEEYYNPILKMDLTTNNNNNNHYGSMNHLNYNNWSNNNCQTSTINQQLNQSTHKQNHSLDTGQRINDYHQSFNINDDFDYRHSYSPSTSNMYPTWPNNDYNNHHQHYHGYSQHHYPVHPASSCHPPFPIHHQPPTNSYYETPSGAPEPRPRLGPGGGQYHFPSQLGRSHYLNNW